MEKRNELLLDAIDNFKSLPVKMQRQLRPLLEDTIDRHRLIEKNKEIIDKFFADLAQEFMDIGLTLDEVAEMLHDIKHEGIEDN